MAHLIFYDLEENVSLYMNGRPMKLTYYNLKVNQIDSFHFNSWSKFYCKFEPFDW